MRKLFTLAFPLVIFLVWSHTSSSQISLTGGTYSQDFNTLASTGTSSVLPTGWLLSESGTSAANNGSYTAGTGSGNGGDVYSFGSTGASDRAFGGLRSGTLVPIIGAYFINNTGGTLTSFTISFTGEQWRAGVTNRGAADRLDFQYSTNATGIADGAANWVNVDALDYNSSNINATAGALNGNDAANRTVISFNITGLNIANGTTFYIRFTDFDISSSDDGLSIDDFSIITSGTAGISLSINDVNGLEGNSGTTPFTFTVSLSAPAPAGGVTFNIGTANNSASAPGDFTSSFLIAQTIPAGSSSYLFTVDVNGDLIPESDETFFVNVTSVTGATIVDGQGLGTITNDECTPSHTIAQIQGVGNTSSFTGTSVTVSGIVTGRKSNGFFLQMPAPGDGNTSTSDGIFVFTSAAPPASATVGNSICITGTVAEFIPSADPNSPSVTEIVSVTNIFTTSTGNALPAPIILTATDTDPAGTIFQLEKYEGMRVQVPSLTVVAPTGGNVNEPTAIATSNGFFYGVITGVQRPFREPGIRVNDPLPPGSPCCIPRWDANPELIGVASLALTGSTAINVGVGAILTNLTGPLDYSNRYYTIDPDVFAAPVISNNNLTYTAVPVQLPTELTVASFNLERFFDNINDPSVGEPVLTTAAYNNRLNKASLAIRNVLNLPDIIGVVEVENLTTLQALAAKINADVVTAGGINPQYQAYLVEGNDVGGIDVGFLVKTTRVTVVDVIQYGKTATYIDPNTGMPAILNDRPPLVLHALFSQPGCASQYPITVIVNHLRSLLEADDPVSGNRVRTKRRAQAEYLANLIQSFQIANPAEKIISVGDYNAFQFNDGYVDMIGTIKGTPAPANQVVLASPDLVNPDLIDLVDLMPASERYSYSFTGTAQVLDHVLINQVLMNDLSRFHIARLDSDFPEIYRSDATRPERVSDHDAAVAYFLFEDVTLPTAICQPATITLVNGTATLPASAVDGGSTDDCGGVTLSLSQSVFNCDDIGTNNVTLTVTDGTGNISTCTAVVTVVGEVPTCGITAVPENDIYTGGIPTNIYLGYGPQSVTLNVTASGGGPFTYSWSPTVGLSSTNSSNPVFTPTTGGTYVFTVTVTNSYGCTTTCTITICVLDIRVAGTNGKKVYVCHVPSGNPGNGQTLELNVNAVNAHLTGHEGDRLGECGVSPCGNSNLLTRGNNVSQVEVSEELGVSVLPNPSRTDFTLLLKGFQNSPISLRIFDVSGRVISMQNRLSATATIVIGSDLPPGIYFAEVVQGTENKVVKLFKQ